MTTPAPDSDLARFLDARDFLLAHRTDYDAAVRGFRWPALTHFNWALDHFDTMARGNAATGLWLIAEDGSEQRCSFEQLRARSNQVANLLRRLGARRGERILLMLGNEVPLWETMLASIKLGTVVIPATTLLTREDLVDRLERGQVRHVVTTDAFAARFDGLADGLNRVCVGTPPAGWTGYDAARDEPTEFAPDGPTRVDEPILLYFTSGTTSKPKLVQHSHQSYPVGHLSTMYWLGLKPGDVHWTISSPGWAKHAWSCFFGPWNAGATVFIYNYARFDGPAVLDTLVRCGVTSLCAPPTVWRLLIQQPLAQWKTHLRELIGAGEPLNPEVIEQVKAAWGITIRDGYGQTETTCQIGNTPGQPVKAGSMGRPLPGYPIRLLDADGQPAEEGEICIDLGERPLALMAGYQDDPAKTAEVMRDGHYHTGDVAMRDADGYITYVGRSDDVFKSSGYRISPFELESVLIEHPAIGEAAVVPVPDAVKGLVPKAFVVLRPGFEPTQQTAAAVFAFSRQRLAGYKRIRWLEFAELPKTISGKIRRVELRGRERDKLTRTERAAGEYAESDFGG